MLTGKGKISTCCPSDFSVAGSSLFLRPWYHMWRLVCTYLFLVSPSFPERVVLCGCDIFWDSSFIFLSISGLGIQELIACWLTLI